MFESRAFFPFARDEKGAGHHFARFLAARLARAATAQRQGSVWRGRRGRRSKMMRRRKGRKRRGTRKKRGTRKRRRGKRKRKKWM